MLNTLFVVDDIKTFDGLDLNVISFDTYLREHPKLKEPKVRVINLCDTNRYLSQGYYCSLLAEARDHQVLPSVKTINELRNGGAVLWVEKSLLGKSGAVVGANTFVMCMGEVADEPLKKLANYLYQEFSAPILSVTIDRDAHGCRVVIERVDLASLNDEQKQFCFQTLESFSKRQWRQRSGGKKYRWDMAILIDPEETVPPSNKGAIARFIKAGEKLGIRVKTITADDFNQLAQFDALFIRETTAIDHHTYRFARKAESLGVVVIDDSTSILRCCNKVFLHDAFSYRKVPSLLSLVVTDAKKETLEELQQQLGFPMVLKMPEGSFSKGVFKVETPERLQSVLEDLLKESALVLAQEYLFTDYDWRIGIINGRAIYACRYYMAKNHWQIYNHGSKRFFSGGFDALPTFEVPGQVLKAALKAAEVIGNGLYGVDIKESNGKAYVLEVNDNPSIEQGVEDAYLGEELYMQIMAEFHRRLENRGL